VPKELKDAAAPVLERYRWLVPKWVRLMSVTSKAELDARAEVESVMAYHRANLTLGGQLLDCDEHEREWVLVHEITHTQLAPIERMWDAVIEMIPKKMRPAAERMFDDALEESVSGLAYALVKEIPE
jgi:hypothetical protein